MELHGEDVHVVRLGTGVDVDEVDIAADDRDEARVVERGEGLQLVVSGGDGEVGHDSTGQGVVVDDGVEGRDDAAGEFRDGLAVLEEVPFVRGYE